MSGKFITIEGTDGSGKTTQIGLIKEYLEKSGKRVLLAREPGGTVISEKIRMLILDRDHTEMSHVAETLLYAAARAQLVYQVIRPALEDNMYVICDRFIDSSFVYQGFGRGIGVDTVERINHVALNGVFPDLTIFMDMDPEVAHTRMQERSEPDRIEMEQLAFHNLVYKGYKELVMLYPGRIRSVDASPDVAKVFDEIRCLIDELLRADPE